ncbi:MAG: molybdenum cofactor guanylyltransferase [Dehalococcoidales bacterium]|nr:molybdenum cofactor guanylyltransferase [Dehalococcoidales bacterium]
MSTNSIVLAGGKGLRLGHNKALVELDGENLLQRVISRLGFLSSDIILVVAGRQQPLKIAGYPKLKIVTDIYPGKGPLVGIYSGLLSSDSAYNLVVACDMPFLNKHLIGYMLDVSVGFDITIPRLGNMVEPLHAIYSKNCLKAIEKLLVEDNLKIDSLLKMVKVRYVEVGEIDSFDPEHLSFFNVNTKADLDIARELAEKAA